MQAPPSPSSPPPSSSLGGEKGGKESMNNVGTAEKNAAKPAPGELDETRVSKYISEFLNYSSQIATYKRKVYRAKIPNVDQFMEKCGDQIKKQLPANGAINPALLQEEPKTPIETRMDNYIGVFNSSKDQLSHLIYVKEQIFKPNKLKIILDASSDDPKYEWLGADNAKVILKFGKGDKMRNDIAIYASSLYRDAVKFRREKLEELASLSAKGSSAATLAAEQKERDENTKYELSHPIGMLYCFYRMFVFCSDDPAERDILGNHVCHLRKLLGLASADKPQVKTSALCKAIKKYTKGKIDPTDISGGDSELVSSFVEAVEQRPELDGLMIDVISDIDFGGNGIEILGDMICKVTDPKLHDRVAAISSGLNADNLPEAIKRMVPKGAMPEGGMLTPESMNETMMNAARITSAKLGENAINAEATNAMTSGIKHIFDTQFKERQRQQETKAIIIPPKRPMVEEVKLNKTRLAF